MLAGHPLLIKTPRLGKSCFQLTQVVGVSTGQAETSRHSRRIPSSRFAFGILNTVKIAVCSGEVCSPEPHGCRVRLTFNQANFFRLPSCD
jgi:hypothetical protein